MRSEGKHVLSHAAIYLVARGLPGVIAFLAIPLFTRLLDPADYGRYALVAATVNLLNALLFQWLRLSLLRYLPAHKDDPARLKSVLVSASIVLVVALGAAVALACLLPVGQSWRAVLVACWAVLSAQAAFDLCCEYARAIIQPWHYMVLQVARSAATVLLGAGLVLLGSGWWGPLAGTAAGMVAAIAYAGRRDWSDVRFLLDRKTLADVCRYGVPLSLTVALAMLIYSCDRYLIALFMGEEAAGLYSVAVDFTAQSL